jgi:adenylate cyclase
MPAVRRLAAILAADVAGYSRLMGADEEGTHERLKAHRRELVDPKVKEHRGRIVKNTGDGMLAEFSSVVDAVRCAAEIQRAMVDRDAQLSQDRHIKFRIGINLGDIIVDEHDIFGDGVNVAARLEALAEPGGVCISRVVRDQIRDKLPYPFIDRGEHTVKNITRPVRVYVLTAAAVSGLPPASVIEGGSGTITASMVSRLSIVVLPFTNLSNDPEQEYFADGITDDLTTDLSRISGSFVIARNTAFTYKGKPVDAKQVGRELGVRYILEGSVRRTGEQIRLNVQLIDAETGAYLWADRINTDRAKLAGAQDEITGRLARTLQLELVQAVGHRIEREKEANPDARDLIMQARAKRSYSVAGRHEVLGIFERALAIDPRSVDARIGIARISVDNIADGWSTAPRRDEDRAERLLAEALELDPNNAWLHGVKGQLRRLQNRLAESKVELETALTLDPNYADAFRQLGQTLMYLGQPEAGIPYIEKAIRLSPREPSLPNMHRALGVCHLLLGQVDEAVDLLRRARAGQPQFWYIHYWLAGALGLKGEIEEAKAALAESLTLNPEVNSLAQQRASHPWGTTGYWELYEKTMNVGLRQAGLPNE